MVLKTEKIRKIMNTEIGLMMMCGETDCVLRIEEAFDFQNRLWVIMELMDDATTTYI